MEYCGGGSVADLVHAADGPLDQDIIAYLCAETLSGLTYLHAIGKVPRLPATSPRELQRVNRHNACELLPQKTRYTQHCRLAAQAMRGLLSAWRVLCRSHDSFLSGWTV